VLVSEEDASQCSSQSSIEELPILLCVPHLAWSWKWRGWIWQRNCHAADRQWRGILPLAPFRTFNSYLGYPRYLSYQLRYITVSNFANQQHTQPWWANADKVPRYSVGKVGYLPGLLDWEGSKVSKQALALPNYLTYCYYYST
jgi:hypothetical protein